MSTGVKYTPAVTYAQLLTVVNKYAEKLRGELHSYDALDDLEDFYSGDCKVTTQLEIVFSDKSSIEFYDYKATAEYGGSDSGAPTIQGLRAKPYEYHVQCSSHLVEFVWEAMLEDLKKL